MTYIVMASGLIGKKSWRLSSRKVLSSEDW